MRERWRRHRAALGLHEATPESDFAAGGLAALAKPLDVRVVVLPADPELTDVISLDADTNAWLAGDRPSPCGGQTIPWGQSNVATSHALARATVYGQGEPWDRYIALNRHGGVEAGSAHVSWQTRDLTAFALRTIVAIVWATLAVQVEAAERWQIGGPWEITIALRGTRGATLGDFAEGWAQQSPMGRSGPTCGEPAVLHRWETATVDPGAVALDAGARLENSFGTTHQRHLARSGEFAGNFDPRLTW